MKRLPVVFGPSLALLCLVAAPPVLHSQPPIGYDPGGNGLSDIWEIMHGASGLAGGADQDKDGWTNKSEEEAGTDPLDGASFPYLQHFAQGTQQTGLEWPAQGGKHYTLQFKPAIDSAEWTDVPGGSFMAEETALEHLDVLTQGAAEGFYRLTIADDDTDGDGLSDWEEITLGYNPRNPQSQRTSQNDYDVLDAGMDPEEPTEYKFFSAACYDTDCWERWPDPGLLVIRRVDNPNLSGQQIGLAPVTVNFTISGTATRDVDYTLGFAGNSVTFAPGQREYFIKVTPLQDTEDGEVTETVILTLTDTVNDDYTVTGASSQTVSIVNQTATSGPSPEEAARFLIQASFGPNQDAFQASEYIRPGETSPDDQIPENVEEVMALGFEGWINQQLARPVGLLKRSVYWQLANTNNYSIYNYEWKNAIWGRWMELRHLEPDVAGDNDPFPAEPTAPPQDPDPLRQRMAFALSQIFVISLRQENIGTNRRGMTDFYDTLITHALGNYRTLLGEVTLHADMGIYLTYVGNQKEEGARHPDENYAREVMQLFTIGLWQLNPDGTRTLDGNLQPIPTYDNDDITQFARVFTGLGFTDGFDTTNPYSADHESPMKGYDLYHEMGQKVLLNGVTIPARPLNSNENGAITISDVNVALDCLFNHPNVGPFVSRQLIQRFVTSNPSPEYVGRVAAVFNDDGSPQHERGDLGAVIKAILLDPEARIAAKMSDPTFGKMREPFLRVANYLKAFNAYPSVANFYYLDNFYELIGQDPMNSPSVFNFYLPHYSPPGELAALDLAAPEFQVLNATTAAKGLNYFFSSSGTPRSAAGLNPQGSNNPQSVVRLNLNQEKTMNAVNDTAGVSVEDAQLQEPEPLIRRLDLAMTGGTLEPETMQIIYEAMARCDSGTAWEWVKHRLNAAIYLTLTSPEMAILH